MTATETNKNTVMSFGEFVSEVKDHLQSRYPDCDIRVGHADKNNGLRLTGITILPEGQTVTPTIYMEKFYEEYRAGRQIESIASAAAQLYEDNKLKEDFVLPDVTDFEVAKHLICFKPINRERNCERLKSMPHRDFLDLAIVYFIPISIYGEKSGTITITDYLFSKWQTDEETLYKYAFENTKRLYPIIMQSVEEVIKDMGGEDAMEELIAEKNAIPPVPMYILRCCKGDVSNAAAMFYGDILREFGRQHGNFYILPSSIFEVLLVPAGPEPADSSFMCPIVRTVNAEQVEFDEILSDNAYLYHADTGEIEILS